MSAFVWKHGVTADDARRLIQMKLAGDGVAQHVIWNGNRFTASFGWGFILKVIGEVTNEVVRLDQASGPMAQSIIAKSREELALLFPDGCELSTAGDAVARG